MIIIVTVVVGIIIVVGIVGCYACFSIVSIGVSITVNVALSAWGRMGADMGLAGCVKMFGV